MKFVSGVELKIINLTFGLPNRFQKLTPLIATQEGNAQ